MTFVAAAPNGAVAAPGVFGAAPCRDLVLGVAGMFAVRAVAAVVDPLSTAFDERLHVSAAAFMLVVLVGIAAHAMHRRGREPRSLVDPALVPGWARPGGGLTFALAILTTLISTLALVVVRSDSQSLLDAVVGVSAVVYPALALRLSWAAASGRMSTLVAVAPPTRRLRIAVTAAAISVALLVAATAASVPGILARDHKIAERNRAVAECQRLAELSLYSGMTRGSLTGQVLAQRVQDLATAARSCDEAGSL